VWNCEFQSTGYFGVMRYVIVDLEATCWMQRVVPERMEIIEIGSVLLTSNRRPIQNEFASYVRPLNEPTLSAFCMGLTGIQQQEIDKAEDFSKVFPRFLNWIGPEPYRLCSWSTYDLDQFKTDCARHGLPLPSQFSNHINLKQEFARLEGVHACGMKRALALCQLPVDGKPHRALDDARNIAKLAIKKILHRIPG
jgi:3'-5' exoribonuclease 1